MYVLYVLYMYVYMYVYECTLYIRVLLRYFLQNPTEERENILYLTLA